MMIRVSRRLCYGAVVCRNVKKKAVSPITAFFFYVTGCEALLLSSRVTNFPDGEFLCSLAG